MIPFKNFTKKFVCLYFSEQSNQRLREWALQHGFDLETKFDGTKQNVEDFDFHITVFFTTSEHATIDGLFDVKPFSVHAKSFELLGENQDIPVIKIDTDNDQLMAIRRRFEDHGYRDAWPEYKPHISLSYNRTNQPDVDNLQLPEFDIMVEKMKISPQKLTT